MSAFRKGAKAAEDASKIGGSKFSKTDYFAIKDEKDPVRIVRFLTDFDSWITTTMHPSMPTRPQPSGYKGTWPQSMGAVCRMDKSGGDRTFPEHDDCYHCITKYSDGAARKKNERTWAIGILREEITLADGSTGHKDKTKMVTYTKDDGTTEEREEIAYVVFCMAWSNFWSPIEAIAQMKGTCLDRDFRVIRKGFTMNDTEYSIAPYDPEYVDLGDGKGARVLDMRDADILARYQDAPDLEGFISNQASDEFYHRFFDVRFPFPASKTGAGASGAAGANPAGVTTPTNDVPVADLQALANRLTPAAPAAQATAYPATATPASVGLASVPQS
jgi:hypothetical protein